MPEYDPIPMDLLSRMVNMSDAELEAEIARAATRSEAFLPAASLNKASPEIQRILAELRGSREISRPGARLPDDTRDALDRFLAQFHRKQHSRPITAHHPGNSAFVIDTPEGSYDLLLRTMGRDPLGDRASYVEWLGRAGGEPVQSVGFKPPRVVTPETMRRLVADRALYYSPMTAPGQAMVRGVSNKLGLLDRAGLNHEANQLYSKMEARAAAARSRHFAAITGKKLSQLSGNAYRLRSMLPFILALGGGALVTKLLSGDSEDA